MNIPLALMLGLQKPRTIQTQFKSVRNQYDQFLQRKTFVYDPLFRVDHAASLNFEKIAKSAVNGPVGLEALTLALLSGKPDSQREHQLLARLTSLKAVNQGQQTFMIKYGRTYLDWINSFADRTQIPRVADPYLKISPSKETNASLLLLKANLMPDVNDLKWDVYNRLVEDYRGTAGAAEARLTLLRKKHLQAGDQFPDFISKDSDGKKFQLTTLRGKVVVLEFWANWCPSCQRTIPVMQGVEKTFAGKPVEFIGVNSDGDSPVVKELQAKWGMTTRTLVDGSPTGPISTRYAIMAWPSFFVIGKDGKVVYRSAGIDADGLTAAINEASK